MHHKIFECSYFNSERPEGVPGGGRKTFKSKYLSFVKLCCKVIRMCPTNHTQTRATIRIRWQLDFDSPDEIEINCKNDIKKIFLCYHPVVILNVHFNCIPKFGISKNQLKKKLPQIKKIKKREIF